MAQPSSIVFHKPTVDLFSHLYSLFRFYEKKFRPINASGVLHLYFCIKPLQTILEVSLDQWVESKSTFAESLIDSEKLFTIFLEPFLRTTSSGGSHQEELMVKSLIDAWVKSPDTNQIPSIVYSIDEVMEEIDRFENSVNLFPQTKVGDLTHDISLGKTAVVTPDKVSLTNFVHFRETFCTHYYDLSWSSQTPNPSNDNIVPGKVKKTIMLWMYFNMLGNSLVLLFHLITYGSSSLFTKLSKRSQEEKHAISALATHNPLQTPSYSFHTVVEIYLSLVGTEVNLYRINRVEKELDGSLNTVVQRYSKPSSELRKSSDFGTLALHEFLKDLSSTVRSVRKSPGVFNGTYESIFLYGVSDVTSLVPKFFQHLSNSGSSFFGLMKSDEKFLQHVKPWRASIPFQFGIRPKGEILVDTTSVFLEEIILFPKAIAKFDIEEHNLFASTGVTALSRFYNLGIIRSPRLTLPPEQPTTNKSNILQFILPKIEGISAEERQHLTEEISSWPETIPINSRKLLLVSRTLSTLFEKVRKNKERQDSYYSLEEDLDVVSEKLEKGFYTSFPKNADSFSEDSSGPTEAILQYPSEAFTIYKKEGNTLLDKVQAHVQFINIDVSHRTSTQDYLKTISIPWELNLTSTTPTTPLKQFRGDCISYAKRLFTILSGQTLTSSTHIPPSWLFTNRDTLNILNLKRQIFAYRRLASEHAKRFTPSKISHVALLRFTASVRTNGEKLRSFVMVVTDFVLNEMDKETWSMLRTSEISTPFWPLERLNFFNEESMQTFSSTEDEACLIQGIPAIKIVSVRKDSKELPSISKYFEHLLFNSTNAFFTTNTNVHNGSDALITGLSLRVPQKILQMDDQDAPLLSKYRTLVERLLHENGSNGKRTITASPLSHMNGSLIDVIYNTEEDIALLKHVQPDVNLSISFAKQTIEKSNEGGFVMRRSPVGELTPVLKSYDEGASKFYTEYSISLSSRGDKNEVIYRTTEWNLLADYTYGTIMDVSIPSARLLFGRFVYESLDTAVSWSEWLDPLRSFHSSIFTPTDLQALTPDNPDTFSLLDLAGFEKTTLQKANIVQIPLITKGESNFTASRTFSSVNNAKFESLAEPLDFIGTDSLFLNRPKENQDVVIYERDPIILEETARTIEPYGPFGTALHHPEGAFSGEIHRTVVDQLPLIEGNAFFKHVMDKLARGGDTRSESVYSDFLNHLSKSYHIVVIGSPFIFHELENFHGREKVDYVRKGMKDIVISDENSTLLAAATIQPGLTQFKRQLLGWEEKIPLPLSDMSLFGRVILRKSQIKQFTGKATTSNLGILQPWLNSNSWIAKHKSANRLIGADNGINLPLLLEQQSLEILPELFYSTTIGLLKKVLTIWSGIGLYNRNENHRTFVMSKPSTPMGNIEPDVWESTLDERFNTIVKVDSTIPLDENTELIPPPVIMAEPWLRSTLDRNFHIPNSTLMDDYLILCRGEFGESLADISKEVSIPVSEHHSPIGILPLSQILPLLDSANQEQYLATHLLPAHSLNQPLWMKQYSRILENVSHFLIASYLTSCLYSYTQLQESNDREKAWTALLCPLLQNQPIIPSRLLVLRRDVTNKPTFPDARSIPERVPSSENHSVVSSLPINTTSHDLEAWCTSGCGSSVMISSQSARGTLLDRILGNETSSISLIIASFHPNNIISDVIPSDKHFVADLLIVSVTNTKREETHMLKQIKTETGTLSSSPFQSQRPFPVWESAITSLAHKMENNAISWLDTLLVLETDGEIAAGDQSTKSILEKLNNRINVVRQDMIAMINAASLPTQSYALDYDTKVILDNRKISFSGAFYYYKTSGSISIPAHFIFLGSLGESLPGVFTKDCLTASFTEPGKTTPTYESYLILFPPSKDGMKLFNISPGVSVRSYNSNQPNAFASLPQWLESQEPSTPTMYNELEHIFSDPVKKIPSPYLSPPLDVSLSIPVAKFPSLVYAATKARLSKNLPLDITTYILWLQLRSSQLFEQIEGVMPEAMKDNVMTIPPLVIYDYTTSLEWNSSIATLHFKLNTLAMAYRFVGNMLSKIGKEVKGRIQAGDEGDRFMKVDGTEVANFVKENIASIPNGRVAFITTTSFFSSEEDTRTTTTPTSDEMKEWLHKLNAYLVDILHNCLNPIPIAIHFLLDIMKNDSDALFLLLFGSKSEYDILKKFANGDLSVSEFENSVRNLSPGVQGAFFKNLWNQLEKINSQPSEGTVQQSAKQGQQSSSLFSMTKGVLNSILGSSSTTGQQQGPEHIHPDKAIVLEKCRALVRFWKVYGEQIGNQKWTDSFLNAIWTVVGLDLGSILPKLAENIPLPRFERAKDLANYLRALNPHLQEILKNVDYEKFRDTFFTQTYSIGWFFRSLDMTLSENRKTCKTLLSFSNPLAQFNKRLTSLKAIIKSGRWSEKGLEHLCNPWEGTTSQLWLHALTGSQTKSEKQYEVEEGLNKEKNIFIYVNANQLPTSYGDPSFIPVKFPTGLRLKLRIYTVGYSEPVLWSLPPQQHTFLKDDVTFTSTSERDEILDVTRFITTIDWKWKYNAPSILEFNPQASTTTSFTNSATTFTKITPTATSTTATSTTTTSTNNPETSGDLDLPDILNNEDIVYDTTDPNLQTSSEGFQPVLPVPPSVPTPLTLPNPLLEKDESPIPPTSIIDTVPGKRPMDATYFFGDFRFGSPLNYILFTNDNPVTFPRSLDLNELTCLFLAVLKAFPRLSSVNKKDSKVRFFYLLPTRTYLEKLKNLIKSITVLQKGKSAAAIPPNLTQYLKILALSVQRAFSPSSSSIPDISPSASWTEIFESLIIHVWPVSGSPMELTGGAFSPAHEHMVANPFELVTPIGNIRTSTSGHPTFRLRYAFHLLRSLLVMFIYGLLMEEKRRPGFNGGASGGGIWEKELNQIQLNVMRAVNTQQLMEFLTKDSPLVAEYMKSILDISEDEEGEPTNEEEEPTERSKLPVKRVQIIPRDKIDNLLYRPKDLTTFVNHILKKMQSPRMSSNVIVRNVFKLFLPLFYKLSPPNKNKNEPYPRLITPTAGQCVEIMTSSWFFLPLMTNVPLQEAVGRLLQVIAKYIPKVKAAVSLPDSSTLDTVTAYMSGQVNHVVSFTNISPEGRNASSRISLYLLMRNMMEIMLDDPNVRVRTLSNNVALDFYSFDDYYRDAYNRERFGVVEASEYVSEILKLTDFSSSSSIIGRVPKNYKILDETLTDPKLETKLRKMFTPDTETEGAQTIDTEEMLLVPNNFFPEGSVLVSRFSDVVKSVNDETRISGSTAAAPAVQDFLIWFKGVKVTLSYSKAFGKESSPDEKKQLIARFYNGTNGLVKLKEDDLYALLSNITWDEKNFATASARIIPLRAISSRVPILTVLVTEGNKEKGEEVERRKEIADSFKFGLYIASKILPGSDMAVLIKSVFDNENKLKDWYFSETFLGFIRNPKKKKGTSEKPKKKLVVFFILLWLDFRINRADYVTCLDEIEKNMSKELKRVVVRRESLPVLPTPLRSSGKIVAPLPETPLEVKLKARRASSPVLPTPLRSSGKTVAPLPETPLEVKLKSRRASSPAKPPPAPQTEKRKKALLPSSVPQSVLITAENYGAPMRDTGDFFPPYPRSRPRLYFTNQYWKTKPSNVQAALTAPPIFTETGGRMSVIRRVEKGEVIGIFAGAIENNLTGSDIITTDHIPLSSKHSLKYSWPIPPERTVLIKLPLTISTGNAKVRVECRYGNCFYVTLIAKEKLSVNTTIRVESVVERDVDPNEVDLEDEHEEQYHKGEILSFTNYDEESDLGPITDKALIYFSDNFWNTSHEEDEECVISVNSKTRVKKSEIIGAGYGLFTKGKQRKGTVIALYDGEVVSANNSKSRSKTVNHLTLSPEWKLYERSGIPKGTLGFLVKKAAKTNISERTDYANAVVKVKQREGKYFYAYIELTMDVGDDEEIYI